MYRRTPKGIHDKMTFVTQAVKHSIEIVNNCSVFSSFQAESVFGIKYSISDKPFRALVQKFSI